MGTTWSANNIPEQAGKVVLVTGANSGIGFFIAQELGRAKAQVILGCRDEKRGSDALASMRAAVPEGNFTLKLLDVSSLADVERFANEFLREYKRLDILINNAGVMTPPTYRTSVDGFEIQMATNHLGPFALTGRLMPLLEATPGARVVAVSSLAAFQGAKYDNIDFTLGSKKYNARGIYGDSKLANQLFMDELGRRHPKILSVGAHPGLSNSNLHTGNRFSKLTWAMQSSLMGALPILRAAVEPDLVSGAYFAPRGLFGVGGHPTGKTFRPSAARDAAYAARYWDASEKATGVRF